MENKDPIPFNAFEAVVARFDRVHLRDHVVIILLIILLLATNIAWVVYESQWQYVDTTTVTQEVDAKSDGEGNINLNTVGGDYDGRKSESKTDSDEN